MFGMTYEERLQKASADMKTAEDDLLETGFSEQQWTLLRQYIQASILHFQLLYGRALHQVAERESQRPTVQ